MGVLKSVVSKSPRDHYDSHNFIGAESFATRNPGYSFLNMFTSDAYASEFPSVRAITNEFMTIRPFTINEKGVSVESAVKRALYHPNQEDSSVAFAEKLAALALSHRKFYILVWRNEAGEAKPGGTITPNNIAGFTFLERPGITRRDRKTYYNIGSQEFNEKEVMVIPGGVDPNNLGLGYAPGEAARRWATLDDYIADYQKGFFENGAVPSGQFIITSPTKTDFDDTVDRMQEKHRGAGNNNNVQYTRRPIDPNTDKPSVAKVEWLPFASTNKEIDFKNLFEQVNKRIDSSYGVPASIRGVGENNNYATARTDQQNFIRLAVAPLALRIYTQITHELNRITNGLGVAVTYKIKLPAIADEELVQAETKKVEADTIINLRNAGYDLDAIVEALKMSSDYKKLGKAAPASNIDDDEDDVDENGEVDTSPDPDKIDGVTPVNEAANGKNPKDQISEIDREYYDDQLSAVIRKHMQIQIDGAVEEARAKDEYTEEEKDDFVDAMMVVIVAVMIAEGTIQYVEGEQMLKDADISTKELSTYVVSEEARESYTDYLKDVARSYMDDTAASIRAVLAQAEEAGWTAAELEQRLQNIMESDEWRVKRLATTEVNRSQSVAGVDSMKKIQDESEATIEKSLLHTGSDEPCEFCRIYIDQWIAVDDIMITKGTIITGADGGMFDYDWDTNEGHDVHANGHCVPQFRVAS